MSGEWIGKNEPWPAHSRPEAQRALKSARAQGFLFRKTTSHAFGRLRCADGIDPCEISIYSTSGTADGSATARVVRDFIRRCPHRFGVAGQLADEVCAELAVRLGDCEHLLDAAEHLMARDEYRRRFEGRLDQYDEDDDDAHIAAAVELEELMRVAEQAGLTLVAAVRPVDSWPPMDGARELLRDVAATMSAVEARAGSLDEACPELAEELGRISGRLTRLARLV